jgi:hypothetical protein
MYHFNAIAVQSHVENAAPNCSVLLLILIFQ